METQEQLLEKCLTVAKNSGVPQDQAKRFIESGYIPYPWQWKFHAVCREADREDGPVQIGAGGARGPGKSHAIFAQGTLDDSQRVSGLKGLFLRQTGLAAKESLEDLVTKVLANKVEYEYSANKIKFPNGSRVLLGGFKDEKDIDKYIGIEYDWIAIEEINQLSEGKVERLRGSLRTSKSDWRPRLYSSFNPGGIGHGYVKSTYVEPYKSETERGTRFIPATWKDNPLLNKEYISYLEGLSGQLGMAWREGDFDILAGQFFTEYREHIHTMPAFSIPSDWKKICAMDYGLNAPSSLGWYAVDEEGLLYKYRELYRSGLTFSKLAEEFVSMTPANEEISYLVADPSIWNRDGRSDDGLSGAEIFENRYRELTKKSIRFERGNNDRLAGWAVYREYLRPFKKSDKVIAKLRVMDTCPNWIRTIPLQVHDTRNPEDLDTDVEDHAHDETRYLLMSRPKPTITAEQKETMLFNQAMKRKNQGQQRKRLFV